VEHARARLLLGSALAVIGHATNIVTGLAVSLQDAVLPATVIAVGIWIAYSGGGPYDVALAVAAMLSMAGIVVAAAILTPIGMPTVPIYEVVGIGAPFRGKNWRTGRSRPASERTMNTIWWTCSVPGGNPPTSPYKPALTAAYNVLQHTNARIEHIILLGDGDAGDSSSALVTQIHRAGVIISAVAIVRTILTAGIAPSVRRGCAPAGAMAILYW
jgi:hypothetical protein